MRSKVLCAILAFSLIMAFAGNSWSDDEGSKSLIVDDGIYRHPIMKPDMATLREWIKDYENAPKAFIDRKLMKTMPLTGSLDLLSHLQYTPSERNQGTCGDCWVWSGTGILEVAHSVQDSIKDRLSIQYMNSCYSTAYACCGGNLTKFSDFYNSAGYVYPWSNTNASFQDASKRCSDGSSSVSCGSVSTSPSYGPWRCHSSPWPPTGCLAAGTPCYSKGMSAWICSTAVGRKRKRPGWTLLPVFS